MSIPTPSSTVLTDSRFLNRAAAMPAVLLLVLASRLVLAILLVPPWQGPDEPPHFLRVQLLLDADPRAASEGENRTLEGEIIRSMAAHDWWRAYDSSAPSPLPADFSDQVIVGNFGRQNDPGPAYYVPASLWVRLTGATELLAQYEALRWFSALLALLTLACAYAGTRLWLGEPVAVGAGVVLALHPQFALIGTAVNPSMFVNLAGAVLWWQSGRLVLHSRLQALPVAVAAVLAAVFAKRAAAPLMLMLAAVVAVVLVGRRLPLSRRIDRYAQIFGRLAWAATLVAVALAVSHLLLPSSWLLVMRVWSRQLAVWMSAARPVIGGELGRLAHYWSEAVFAGRGVADPWGFTVRFHTQLFESFWYYAGWLRFPAPPAWYLAVLVLVIVMAWGVCRGVRAASISERTALAVATFLVATQLTAIFLAFLRNGMAVQGHYLFLVEAPLVALLVWGAHRFRSGASAWVNLALAVAMATLDVFAWLGGLVPVYAGWPTP